MKELTTFLLLLLSLTAYGQGRFPTWFVTNSASAIAPAAGWVLGYSNGVPVWTINGGALTNLDLSSATQWTNDTDQGEFYPSITGFNWFQLDTNFNRTLFIVGANNTITISPDGAAFALYNNAASTNWFTVDNVGNVQAHGIYYGNGSGLTNVTSSGSLTNVPFLNAANQFTKTNSFSGLVVTNQTVMQGNVEVDGELDSWGELIVFQPDISRIVGRTSGGFAFTDTNNAGRTAYIIGGGFYGDGFNLTNLNLTSATNQSTVVSNSLYLQLVSATNNALALATNNDNLLSQNATNQGVVVSNGVVAHTITIAGTAGDITSSTGTAQAMSGNPSTTLSLPATGTAGTYYNATFDAKGRETSGVTTPTYALSLVSGSGAPAVLTTYHFGINQGTWTTSSGTHPQYYQAEVPVTGQITKAYIHFFVGGTPASAGTITLQITNITAATSVNLTGIVGTAVANDSATTGLTFAVTAGDAIAIRLTTPNWGTLPTATTWSGVLLFQ